MFPLYPKRDRTPTPICIPEASVMLSHSTTPNIDELLQRLETILLQAWSETGFGHIEVSSERFKEDKIRVVLQGSTHYRYVITNQEVEQKMNGI
ncbi:hypothetical protein [Coleofasciculus sp. F4-SAH-05]|uniref:hypothetical protein n=1 Tax=Coleofasciculus sp. F4-SAH-05 TaxID=3069525 RepID=UPI0032FFC466